MFSHIIKRNPGIPLRVLTNKRYFISSSFVCNNRKEGDENKGENKNENKNENKDNKSEENKQNTNDDNKQNSNTKTEPQKQQEKKESTLEDQLKDCTTKYKTLQESYLLSLADQENLRQRTIREVNIAKEFGIQKFAKDILDTIDILGMALNSVPPDFQSNETCMKKESKELAEQLVNLYQGVSMTETELQRTLKRHGVERDDPIDQEFDPNKHEAVFQAPVPDKKPGTIFTVQKVGYTLKNRVLRPAQVGVVAET